MLGGSRGAWPTSGIDRSRLPGLNTLGYRATPRFVVLPQPGGPGKMGIFQFVTRLV